MVARTSTLGVEMREPKVNDMFIGDISGWHDVENYSSQFLQPNGRNSRRDGDNLYRVYAVRDDWIALTNKVDIDSWAYISDMKWLEEHQVWVLER